jgi:site-specific recombinase XerD
MQEVDIGEALKNFFSSYLLEQKGVSPNTLKSYRDTFRLLLEFLRHKKGVQTRLKPSHLDTSTILDFLKHLEDAEHGRGNSAKTRNYRLAAIHSFFTYLSWHHPHLERQAHRICAIPFKRTTSGKLDYLTHRELDFILRQVDVRQGEGFRDFALLNFIYNTGARAHEAAQAKISWFNFQDEIVTIHGKGRKEGDVPLWPTTAKIIQTYLKSHRRRSSPPYQDFLFINQRGQPLTRFGVRHIVQKYIQQASVHCPSLKTKRLSPHSLRHTTAMHLLDAGNEPNLIKAWLRHADLKSTSKYLHADLTHKKRALDKFAPPIYVKRFLEEKSSESPDQLRDWLKGL